MKVRRIPRSGSQRTKIRGLRVSLDTLPSIAFMKPGTAPLPRAATRPLAAKIAVSRRTNPPKTFSAMAQELFILCTICTTGWFVQVMHLVIKTASLRLGMARLSRPASCRYGLSMFVPTPPSETRALRRPLCFMHFYPPCGSKLPPVRLCSNGCLYGILVPFEGIVCPMVCEKCIPFTGSSGGL